MYRVGLKDDKLVVEKSQDDGTRNGRKVWVPLEDKKIAKQVIISVKKREISLDGYRYPSLLSGFLIKTLVLLNKIQEERKNLVPMDDKITDEIRKFLDQEKG